LNHGKLEELFLKEHCRNVHVGPKVYSFDTKDGPLKIIIIIKCNVLYLDEEK